MLDDPPAAPAARELLVRILASETFKRSGRARSLLAYLIRREQAGEAERLKGYAIAVDVFGRDSEFDSSTDALVRVQAGRLRELLAQYYASEGRADPLRIVIPRGSYVPIYEKAGVECPGDVSAATTEDPAAATADAAATAHAMRPGRPLREAVAIGQVRLLWSALALVAVLLVVVFYRTTLTDLAGDNIAAASPLQTGAIADLSMSEALPTIRVTAESSDPATRRVAAEFRAAFAGFDTLDLIDSAFSDSRPSPAADQTAFALTVAPAAESGSVLVELKSLGSGKVFLNRIVTAAQAEAPAIGDVVANVASSVAPANGLIYGYLEQNGLQSALTACLMLNEAYYMEQTPARHLPAYQCLEDLAGRDAKSPLVYSELAALHVEAKSDKYAYPVDPSEDQAMAFARRAVQIEPTSPSAHRAIGFVYSRMGNRAEAIRWMHKAYELNTYDLGMAASYGYALVFSGNYSEGAAILQRAVEASSAHPTWWDYGLFLAEFMLNDIDKASRATDALMTPKKSHYVAARLVVAHLRGDERSADALAAELAAAFPKFAADPGVVFEKASYPPDLVRKFTGALRAVGIGAAS